MHVVSVRVSYQATRVSNHHTRQAIADTLPTETALLYGEIDIELVASLLVSDQLLSNYRRF